MSLSVLVQECAGALLPPETARGVRRRAVATVWEHLLGFVDYGNHITRFENRFPEEPLPLPIVAEVFSAAELVADPRAGRVRQVIELLFDGLEDDMVRPTYSMIVVLLLLRASPSTVRNIRIRGIGKEDLTPLEALLYPCPMDIASTPRGAETIVSMVEQTKEEITPSNCLEQYQLHLRDALLDKKVLNFLGPQPNILMTLEDLLNALKSSTLRASLILWPKVIAGTNTTAFMVPNIYAASDEELRRLFVESHFGIRDLRQAATHITAEFMEAFIDADKLRHPVTLAQVQELDMVHTLVARYETFLMHCIESNQFARSIEVLDYCVGEIATLPAAPDSSLLRFLGLASHLILAKITRRIFIQIFSTLSGGSKRPSTIMQLDKASFYALPGSDDILFNRLLYSTTHGDLIRHLSQPDPPIWLPLCLKPHARLLIGLSGLAQFIGVVRSSYLQLTRVLFIYAEIIATSLGPVLDTEDSINKRLEALHLSYRREFVPPNPPSEEVFLERTIHSQFAPRPIIGPSIYEQEEAMREIVDELRRRKRLLEQGIAEENRLVAEAHTVEKKGSDTQITGETLLPGVVVQREEIEAVLHDMREEFGSRLQKLGLILTKEELDMQFTTLVAKEARPFLQYLEASDITETSNTQVEHSNEQRIEAIEDVAKEEIRVPEMPLVFPESTRPLRKRTWKTAREVLQNTDYETPEIVYDEATFLNEYFRHLDLELLCSDVKGCSSSDERVLVGEEDADLCEQIGPVIISGTPLSPRAIEVLTRSPSTFIDEYIAPLGLLNTVMNTVFCNFALYQSNLFPCIETVCDIFFLLDGVLTTRMISIQDAYIQDSGWLTDAHCYEIISDALHGYRPYVNVGLHVINLAITPKTSSTALNELRARYEAVGDARLVRLINAYVSSVEKLCNPESKLPLQSIIAASDLQNILSLVHSVQPMMADGLVPHLKVEERDMMNFTLFLDFSEVSPLFEQLFYTDVQPAFNSAFRALFAASRHLFALQDLWVGAVVSRKGSINKHNITRRTRLILATRHRAFSFLQILVRFLHGNLQAAISSAKRCIYEVLTRGEQFLRSIDLFHTLVASALARLFTSNQHREMREALRRLYGAIALFCNSAREFFNEEAREVADEGRLSQLYRTTTLLGEQITEAIDTCCKILARYAVSFGMEQYEEVLLQYQH
ncbi:hypothetical protein GMRT_13781 [Giardia muris]|uniref:Uncharacterized protein n=1 Tax=Giardia muris TaxID=5742 RepID=A0A4Z1SZ36_GIAMU|nr:hypothetical protein GMRT_13781 [Giardia muris]|eukprot:TNJ28748.1 hypothetical protein GMRT_13781 [Giardia muris]